MRAQRLLVAYDKQALIHSMCLRDASAHRKAAAFPALAFRRRGDRSVWSNESSGNFKAQQI
jgi:hypothetical protein